MLKAEHRAAMYPFLVCSGLLILSLVRGIPGTFGLVLEVLTWIGVLAVAVLSLWCFIQEAGPATAVNKNRFVDDR